MKIAVVTPSWKTPYPWLEQCIASVATQTVTCTHFLVFEEDQCPKTKISHSAEVIRTSRSHGDSGNIARAIGSISAIGRGFDAIAYLDSDNWYESNHLELMLRTTQRSDAAVCSSGRNFYDLSGKLMGKCPEVDGETFVDTNCLFFTRKAFPLVSTWYLMPPHLASVGDRVVWKAVLQSRLVRAHQPLPTTNYRTSYRAHYLYFGVAPPVNTKETIQVTA